MEGLKYSYTRGHGIQEHVQVIVRSLATLLLGANLCLHYSVLVAEAFEGSTQISFHANNTVSGVVWEELEKLVSGEVGSCVAWGGMT